MGSACGGADAVCVSKDRIDERAAYGCAEDYDYVSWRRGQITGLWQTSGRSNTTFKTRCKMEADYSEDASIATDIHIFFKTFIVVFKGL